MKHCSQCGYFSDGFKGAICPLCGGLMVRKANDDTACDPKTEKELNGGYHDDFREGRKTGDYCDANIENMEGAHFHNSSFNPAFKYPNLQRDQHGNIVHSSNDGKKTFARMSVAFFVLMIIVFLMIVFVINLIFRFQKLDLEKETMVPITPYEETTNESFDFDNEYVDFTDAEVLLG